MAVRSSLTDHMSLYAGGPFWYENAAYVADAGEQERFLESVDHMCQAQLRRPSERVDGALVYRSALEHYLLTYGTPQHPPSWVLVEELTIGQLSRLFDNLARTADQNAIARPLGVSAALLSSWLRSYVRVRNICAHHGRLWDRALGVPPSSLVRNTSSGWSIPLSCQIARVVGNGCIRCLCLCRPLSLRSLRRAHGLHDCQSCWTAIQKVLWSRWESLRLEGRRLLACCD